MSLRARLLLLVLLAALPAFALLLWNQADLTTARYQDVRRQVLSLAEQQAAEINRIGEGALQFLVALAEVPVIRDGDPAPCGELLAKIRENYNAYRALIRADRSGNVTCSSVGPGPGIADRDYFKRAIETKAFSVGEYTMGRGARGASIHFSYPIRSANNGEIVGVIAAALDLEWLHDRLASRIGPDTALAVTDRNKTILLRVPGNEEFRGTKMPDRYAAIMDAAIPGVEEVTGLQGKRRLLGFVPIAASNLGLHVEAGIDLAVVFADVEAAKWRGWSLSLGGLAVALFLAWIIGDISIRRPIGALLADIAAWKGGARFPKGRRWPRSELGQIGQAFDDLATDVEQRERQLRASQANLAHREAYLAFVLDRIPAGVAQTNADCEYVFVNKGMCEILGRPKEDILGRKFMEVTHPEDIGRDENLFREALKRREPYTHRKRYMHPDGTVVWTENTVTHLEGDEGIVAVCLRLDERMKAEERQERLINELNHRVKNTLATVQALMRVSRRSSTSQEEFAESFTQRLQALSASHDLLTKGFWESASLSDLVRAELALYGANKFAASGGEVKLNARETIGLGMILHELATNAAKYGAFSKADGRVDIDWQTTGDELRIVWREPGTAPAQDERIGFGTKLIEQTAADLGGAARLTREAGMRTWTITISRGKHTGSPA